jgi:hypothetical protein
MNLTGELRSAIDTYLAIRQVRTYAEETSEQLKYLGISLIDIAEKVGLENHLNDIANKHMQASLTALIRAAREKEGHALGDVLMTANSLMDELDAIEQVENMNTGDEA